VFKAPLPSPFLFAMRRFMYWLTCKTRRKKHG
jgi:hypothetical protein